MTVLAFAFLYIESAMGVVILPPGELGFLDIAIYNWIAFAAAFAGITFTLMCVFDSEKLWFKATKYYDRYVWVTGAGAAFLAELPAIKAQDYKIRTDDPGFAITDEANLTAEELIRRAGLDDE
jgi:hypothetical protein